MLSHCCESECKGTVFFAKNNEKINKTLILTLIISNRAKTIKNKGLSVKKRQSIFFHK